MGEKNYKILDSVAPDRREFVRRILEMAAFAPPAVRTFAIGLVATEALPAFDIETTGPPRGEPLPLFFFFS